jgi:hypothetical protein
MRFYAFHNVLAYCDPDNLILRPEYNNYNKAVCRASFISLLGLPVTIGDNLPDLPEDRVSILKRCIPALDIRPMDIRELSAGHSAVFVNLCIAKKYEQWNTVGLFNLEEKDTTVNLDLINDLNLEEGNYLVYDYWGERFLGVFNKNLSFKISACSALVLSVRKLTGIPQIVSTSRHMTQGGPDLIDVRYDAKANALYGLSEVVKGDLYKIRAYDPKKGEIVEKEIMPELTGKINWEIKI